MQAYTGIFNYESTFVLGLQFIHKTTVAALRKNIGFISAAKSFKDYRL